MIVAGSYSTASLSPEDQPWNECRVLNGQGHELWRQRKLWPAGVNSKGAERYGLPDPGVGALTFEDNAAGDELVIADIDGLGRCVVLICQDCEMPISVPELLSTYQPDWIFTPIFDCSIDPGRWIHARAFMLSPISQARVIAVTNMAYGKPGTGMGLAVGPKETTHGDGTDLDRAFALIKRPEAGEPVLGLVEWRKGVWEQSHLGIAPD